MKRSLRCAECWGGSELLSAGDGYRCEIGDGINIEVERVED